MRLTSKSAIITSAGVILLGASLALSSAGAVSGASAIGASHLFQPATTCNSNTGYCLTESNTGTGTGKHGAIKATTDGETAIAIYGVGYGSQSFGVQGVSSFGEGVVGTSSTGNGVEGQSSDEDGVYGTGGDAGVVGQSSGYGVYASSNNTAAVMATSSSYAGYFEGGDPNALVVLDTSPSGDPLLAENTAGSSYEYFQVDENGDGLFTGSVTAVGGYHTLIRSRGGEKLGASIAMTPQATMEDTGTTRLLNGEGAVRFDPAFASTIDASRGYQVFLTPNGDTRGLYVSAKYEGGFVVRENEHGRSSIYFDYRVVAHPYGASDARLPQLNIKPPTLRKLPKLPKLLQVTHAQP